MPRRPLPLSVGFEEETAVVQRIHRKVVEDKSIPVDKREELLVHLASIVSIFNGEAVRRTRESRSEAG